MSDLPDVAFRADREAGRVLWTVDGDDHTKFFYPPALRDLEYTPHQLIGEMDYAGVDVVLLHTDPMLARDGAFQAECVGAYPDRILSMAPVDEWRIASEPDAVIEELTENVTKRGLHVIKFIAPFAYTADPRAFLREETGNSRARSKMSLKLPNEEDRQDVWAFIVSVSPAPVSEEGAEAAEETTEETTDTEASN